MGDIMLCLKHQISSNIDEFKKVWYELPSTTPKSLNFYDYDSKIRNEKYIEDFIDKLYKAFMQFPDNEADKQIWGSTISRMIEQFANNSEFINNKAINLLLSKNIKDITKEFFKRAKEFDNSMTLEDIGQAMRNVWIMNISQVFLNIDVNITNSVFAYSMLYPYTDNVLDDISLTKEYKKSINIKLKKIIQGDKVEIESDYENALFELIGLINNDFNRTTYKNVYNSILAIHEAQEISMGQQNRTLSPYERDMLDISFTKGGTSVLADGYLVKGELSAQEIKFMLSYGIMLQLCDDLQDVIEDMRNDNVTIFSQTAKYWALDKVANKLLNFIDYVVDVQLREFKYEIKKDMDEFLKQNCFLLSFMSISNSKKYFSKGYIKELEQYIPFRLSFIKKNASNISKRLGNIKKKYNEEKLLEMISYV